MERKIMLASKDRELICLIEMHLLDQGFQIEVEASVAGCLERLGQSMCNLVLLDQQLTGFGGLIVCQRLRAENSRLPIMILGNPEQPTDSASWLEAGADDFVVRPCSFIEMVARIKAILRCQVGFSNHTTELIQHNDLEIDLHRHRVKIAGRSITLTAKEFLLLSLFARNPGRVFSRSQLVEIVWGMNYEGDDHTVHSHINRLRNKIEIDPANPQRIVTVRNSGYKFLEQLAVH